MAKRWTLLVYLAGDNNLDAYGREDLIEMQAVGSTDEVDVVAQFDGMEDGATRRYHLSRSDSLDRDIVAELPEVNTGDPSALVDFVTWALAEYPAERTALILWNHGSGWRDEDIYRLSGIGSDPDPEQPRSLIRGVGTPGVRRALFRSSIAAVAEYPADVRGILFDDTSRDFLDGRELGRVLEAVVAARGGRKLDLLGFDACLMSTIEVAYGVRHGADVMVGSQEIEPGSGWPYGRILSDLARTPDASAEALARTIVDAYVGSAADADADAPATQSTIRLDRLEAATGSVRALADALVAGLEDPRFPARALLPALRRVQKFRDNDCVDLADLTRRLADGGDGGGTNRPWDPRLADAATEVAAALVPGADASVVGSARSHGASVQRANGLSIYVPLVGEPSPAYRDLEFAGASTWTRFLDAFASASR